MDNEPPLSMEMVVVETISAAPKSREGWEAQRGEDEPPLSDLGVFIENMTEMVRRHGVVVSHLALHPDTRAELQARMAGAIKRVPAWLEAKVTGPPLLTPRIFVLGLAQLMGVHREAIERVVAEQVRSPESIEESLAAAPLPEGREEESDSELIGAVGAAMSAHLEALVDIARDIDGRLDSPLKAG